MKIILYLLRFSRGLGLLAIVFGALSGAASAAIVSLITTGAHHSGAGQSARAVGYAALCIFFPLATVVTQHLVARLAQGAVYDLRRNLAKKILATPLRRLEDLGGHRLLTVLTTDISNITNAVITIPILWINAFFTLGLLIYLAWLSWIEVVLLLVFLAVAVVTYQLPARFALKRQRFVRRRTDRLVAHFRSLVGGTKELQMHRDRRGDFLHSLESTAATLRDKSIGAVTLFVAAGSWSHFLLLSAIGLLLFVLPAFKPIAPTVLTSFAFVLIFLASIIQVIAERMANLARANVSLERIEELGLALPKPKRRPHVPEAVGKSTPWRSFELVAVCHTYRREAEDHETFTLGPVDIAFKPGELVILAGGNGSGKTTLAKIIVGLYTPEEGEILLDGRVVDEKHLEAYRQRFSVVFSDFHLFDSLFGLDAPELDREARYYLSRLQLDHKVKVEGGCFSTTDLSQGQRKRLALLTSYLEDREIYLFDEWAADQDPFFKEIFYCELLPELKARGKTVIAISHDDHYYHVADRVLHLKDGRLEEQPVVLAAIAN